MPPHRVKRSKASVTQPISKFKNVIFCEDVRDEVGNKKSLMGVITGDLNVATFPATIQSAVFFEYAPDASDGDKLSVRFRLMQDETEIASGGMEADISVHRRANFILPKSFIVFEKPATFKLLASVNGGPEQEVLSKQILQEPKADSTSLQRLASLSKTAGLSTKT
jgi:hypothetical protein